MASESERRERLALVRELEGAVREHHDYRRLPEHVRSHKTFEEVCERLERARTALLRHWEREQVEKSEQPWLKVLHEKHARMIKELEEQLGLDV